MTRTHIRWLKVVGLVATALITAWGCGPQVTVDDGERRGSFAVVEFDPARSVIPTPNNLTRRNGHVDLPRQCHEPGIIRELREEGLNRLDGFATYKPALQASFSEPIDENSLLGRVQFTCREPVSTPLLACEIGDDDCAVRIDEEMRFDLSDCQGRQQAQVLTATPRDPLPQGATCAVVILDGILTADGKPFQPSATWHLVRQRQRPIEINDDGITNRTPVDSTDITTLSALGNLWDDLHPLLEWLDAQHGIAPESVLLAWEFTTQTITTPLDPAVPTSPAALSAAATDDVQQLVFYRGTTEIATKYDENFYRPGHPPVGRVCDSVSVQGFIPCGVVGTVIEGQYTSPRFLGEADNPGGLPDPITDQWDDPLTPSPFDAAATVKFVAWFPDPTVVPKPSCGYPMAILGHGWTIQKEMWYSTAAEFARLGIASIAIDAVNHSERAVQTVDDEDVGCNNIKTGPTNWGGTAQCYDPILGLNLATSRDNVRQTVLDTLKLAKVVSGDSILQGCNDAGETFCPELAVDGQRIGYAGGSMGCIIGTVITAMSPHVKVSVLNAGGADWVDVLLDTQSAGIKCPIVDALIGQGIVQGNANDLWDSGNNSGALCIQEGWKTDPGLRRFVSLARWLLDPGDPANFIQKIVDKNTQVNVLVQQIYQDPIIPNSATDRLAQLLNLGDDPIPSATASDITHNVQPTPAICAAVSADQDLWVEYVPGAGNPQSNFEHRSISASAIYDDPDGRARRQLQTDVIAFIAESLERVPSACVFPSQACP